VAIPPLSPATVQLLVCRLRGSVLLEGVWFSLAQCGSLLSGAVTLYKAGNEPAAVGLAMLGREELGKYRLLLEQWRESEKTGVGPTVGEVQAICAEHVEKQRKATLSWSFHCRSRFSSRHSDTDSDEAQAAGRGVSTGRTGSPRQLSQRV